MNRNLYRLVQNTFGQWVAVPEIASGKHKGSGLARKALIAAILPTLGWTGTLNAADLPTACGTCVGTGGAAITSFASTGSTADYAISGNVGTVSQVGSSAVVNFKDYNVGAGNSVIYQQVKDLTGHELVSGATFSNLSRIWDANPSVIAGQIHAAAGQNLNLMMINTNGIIFANGAQIDVNSFFAGSLNIKDQFINDLTPVNNVDVSGNPIAQFEGNSGFVKVLEGARITASSGGSVILFAPTVTNKGTIETSGSGQAVLAAGNKVYLIANEKKSDGLAYDSNLRGFLVEVDNTNLADGEYTTQNSSVPDQVTLDGKTIQVGDEYDKLGNATNLGSITSQHGNITMVGLAVNQLGRATATSTLSQNGSIYLYAKDTASNPNAVTDKSADIQIASKRSGKLTLGSSSVTQVIPDTSDSSTMLQSQIDSGTALPSIVRMVGKTIDVESNAVVRSTAGQINVYAVNDPTSLSIFNASANDPFAKASSSQENTSIYIGKNALFDVSGITYEKSVADNYYEFTLRSDELKDSPVNRTTLRGTKVWVDLLKGSPLVSNAADYKANMTVTIGENSTKAGSVSLNSTGQVVVDKNAQFNLSGGKVVYTDAVQETTQLLGSDQVLYSMENAKADTKYISTGVSVDSSGTKTTLYTVTEKNVVKGYTVGKDAGSLTLNAKTAYFAGKVDGSTTTGENQALAGTAPAGASLTINNLVVTSDYTGMSGVMQNVLIGSTPDALPDGFKATDSLTGSQKETLKLDASLFGGTGVNNLSVSSVKTVSVNSPINLADKGSVKLSAHDVAVNANITSTGGTISLTAKDNPNLTSDVATVNIAQNVLLSTAGGWYNDTLGGSTSSTTKNVNAGSISINAENGEIDLGQGSVLNVRGGAYVGARSKVTAGTGGNVTLSAWKIAVDDLLQAHLKGEAIGTGGTLSVTAANIKITNDIQSNSASGTDDSKSILWLNSSFFNQGFSNYNLTGKTGLEVAAGTNVSVRSTNLMLSSEALAAATGSAIESVSSIVTLADRTRAAASVSLTSGSLTDNQGIVTYGVTKVAEGASITVDPTASIKLTSAKAVEVDGSLVAKAGKISLSLQTEDTTPAETASSPTRIHLGSKAVLDVSGTAKLYQDSQGLTKGSVLDGGTVAITSSTYVSTDAGSLIDVHGQSPVYIDLANADGSLGKMVGSNAGTVNISVGTGAYLDNTFNAAAGGTGLIGGTLNLGFTTLASGQMIHVGEYSNLALTTAQTAAQKNQIYADMTDLVSAGFDNIKLTSGDKLKFEGNFSAGLDRTINSMQFVASTFQSDGGNAKIGANIVKFSRSDTTGAATAATPVLGTGNLSVKASLIELTGSTSFSGFNTTDADGAGLTFDSSGEFRLTGGKSTSTLYQTGLLNTLADIDIKAAVVSPSTLADYTINTTGNVNFYANGAATDPISSLGMLTVNANNINQFGNIIAPLGSITLKASNNLVLGSGSTTSVAANDNSVLPLGKTSNATTYYVDVGGTSVAIDANTLASLPVKKIVLDGKTITIQSGAKVDISGGGDLQAWEFTSGTGGSTDILASGDYYALVPSYEGIDSTSDVQESSSALIGQRVYLSGGNGIAAGYYTIMPAHYALLPGAYAIKLSSGISNLSPSSNYVKQDGTSVIAGFVTDSRNTSTTPVNSLWTGFEVLTRAQVMERSGYTLTKASTFFANTAGSSVPNDAGLLQLKTQTALTLAGDLDTAASNGGKGASVDISANKIAIVDGTASSTGEVALDVTSLNKLNASSLLIGGLRTNNSDGTTTINVTSDSVRMNTTSTNPLTGNEVILTANNTINLQNSSSIVATGDVGDTQTYNLSGNHALLRAGASEATFVNTGTIDSSKGTITTDAGTTLVSSNSLIIDATKDSQINGAISFSKNGQSVSGNLSISSSTINLGDAISSSASGLSIDQQRMDSFGSLNSLNLHSYSSFNFYGNATLGSVTSSGQYSLGSLTLDGAGFSGRGASSSLVTINASSITIANSASTDTSFASNSTGLGQLKVNADSLILGTGDKKVAGFSQTSINSTEMKGQGTGTLAIKGDVNVTTNRFSGTAGASQSIEASGNLNTAKKNTNTLADTTGMGADWKFSGSSVVFDTAIESHGGNATLIANSGNVTLGSNADIDVSGKSVVYSDVTSVAPAGKVNITAKLGNIQTVSGAKIDVSSDKGGDAGTLTLSAVKGNIDVISANLLGTNAANSSGSQGDGASLVIDANSITNFNTLNQHLNTGGFAESRDIRLRSGNLALTAETGVIKSHNVSIAVDQGSLSVDNEIDASGSSGGSITLAANNNINLTTNANLHANATEADETGGSVSIATTSGSLNLQSGKISVANSAGEESGSVLLRAPRTDSSVGVLALNTQVLGAQSVVLEGVKTYQGYTRLTANTTSGTSLGVDKILADNDVFMGNKKDIITTLGGVASASNFHLRGGAEVRSTGNLTVDEDVNFYQADRVGDEPGTLTLRAAGNLTVNGSISDGFDDLNHLAKNDSWSYRLIAGADLSAANVMTTNDSGTGNFALAAGKTIRTGTGDIDIAAGGDFDLGKSASGTNQQTATIYTAGKAAAEVDGYTGLTNLADGSTPIDSDGNDATPQFGDGGGSITLNVKGNINGAKSSQLYTDWLWRVGQVDANGNFGLSDDGIQYLQTAWWVNYASFNQGIATFGGGNIKVNAGGTIKDLNLSTVTNGRMASSTPDATKLVVKGGGDISVTAGGDIKGGEYYVEEGNLSLSAQGSIGSSPVTVNGKTKDYYTLIALGNATAELYARQDVNIQTVLNPMTIGQSSTVKQAIKDLFNNSEGLLADAPDTTTYFSTYGEDSSVSLTSLSGDVNVRNRLKANQSTDTVAGVGDILSQGASLLGAVSFAGTLKATAYQGDINVSGESIQLAPQTNGTLSLLANGSVYLNTGIAMSDQELSSIATPYSAPATTITGIAVLTGLTDHADTPLHINDTEPVRIYAENGDIVQLAKDVAAYGLVSAKKVRMIAGRDIINANIVAQNISDSDVTYIKAGRDITQSASGGSNQITLNGPGVLEIEAGRNINLGGSYGIVTQGNLVNSALADEGATVRIATGVPNGVDYTGALDRLIAALQNAIATGQTISASTLWQARWLLSEDRSDYATLGSVSDAQTLLNAVNNVRAMSVAAIEDRVRNMYYLALRETGRDHNDTSSAYYGEYTRGYDTIALLFPGIDEKNADGTSKNYAGSLNVATSRIKTLDGGDIEFMIPGGKLIGGLTEVSKTSLKNISAAIRDPAELGVVVLGSGSVRGFSQDSMVVNQSRILTVGGGDILLWSSDGDIDAGKGKKTATSIPAPIVKVKNGVVTVTVNAAATGSGVGALANGEIAAGDVDLIAPNGTVNAGDAGIRAGNINIAAAVVLGADNISASGTSSGIPVSDTGALSGALAGASGVGGDATKQVADQIAQNSKQASDEGFKKQPSASLINVEVVKIGD